jgi:hypothetical protein
LRRFEATAVAVMDSLMLADGVDQSLITTGLLRLQRFRDELYRCLGRRRDALFELIDGLLAAEAMPSLPHLSLVPVHRRGWGSVYAALAAGEVDAERLAELLVAHRGDGGAPVFAVDASTWARCDAECSPGRGFYYSPTRHSAGQPIVAGWCYSWIAQLTPARDSWTAPIDVRRLRPGEDLGQATAAQVRALTERLGATGTVPLFVFDAGYDPIALTVDLADVAVAVLVRIRSDRVFYADPGARPPGQLGRPRRHGARFLCTDPASWPVPDQTLQARDEQYGRVQVAAWSGAASQAGRPRPLGRLPDPADRGGHGDCGGPAPAPRTWRSPGGPTSGASTSSTPSASASRPWAGPPRGYAPRSRPTAGPGWSSPPTPNCGWPGPSSPIPGCPGNAGCRPPG